MIGAANSHDFRRRCEYTLSELGVEFYSRLYSIGKQHAVEMHLGLKWKPVGFEGGRAKAFCSTGRVGTAPVFS